MLHGLAGAGQDTKKGRAPGHTAAINLNEAMGEQL